MANIPAAVDTAVLRRFNATPDGLRWEAVPLKTYKPEGTHFRDITRQTLFGDEDGLPAQLRYFEVAPGGHSTFERHDHVHAVLILRGTGTAVIGAEVVDLAPFDLVYVPTQTWHQFIAAADEALGFLCLVDTDRDRPVRPDEAERAALKADPIIGPTARF